MHNPLTDSKSISSAFFKVIHKKKKKKSLSLKDIIRIILNINYNTVRFNFTYLEWRKAIKFPVFVKRNVRLNKLKGNLIIPDDIRPGMILLGFGNVGHFDRPLTRLLWDVDGDVIFKGSALIKFGAKIVVGKGATLQLGDKFRLSTNSSIICYKNIVFGSACRISWDVQIMDTDFHKIKTLLGEQINAPKEILIGDHVWIGAKSTILKGVKISDDCIVASNSVVTKIVEGTHQIIAGMPAKVVRTGVTWDG